nr:3,4-dihydroxy-2-butanone-4-phosphate synthase [Pseudomonas sp.]
MLDPQRHSRLHAAVAAYREGRPVLLLDDADRENEADLVAAAENLTLSTMVKMIRDGSGIVCLCLDDASVRCLDLPPMVKNNQARHGTGFTVSIEAAEGVTTGVSAADRMITIRAALDSCEGRNRIVSPGHIFPLRAREGGVLTRRGHAEGSVELAMLAGLRPAAVLCELMNPDGSMARGADVEHYAQQHGIPVLTIEEIVRYREEEALLASQSVSVV